MNKNVSARAKKNLQAAQQAARKEVPQEVQKAPPTLRKPDIYIDDAIEKAMAFAEPKQQELLPNPVVSAKANAKAAKRVFYAPEGHRRLTINLPKDTHKELRMRAVLADVTVTDIVLGLVEKELKRVG